MSCRTREASRDAARLQNAPGPSTPAAQARGSTPIPSPEATAVEFAFGAGRARFFVPPDRDPGARFPLLVLLHGLGGSGTAMAQDLELDAFARRKGFAYVAPDGSVDSMGRRFWNAGPTCCDFFRAGIDDVSRLHALIGFGVRELPVDRARVFVVGYSNGGFMAHRLACERSADIRAIVSIAATGPDACSAANAVSVLAIHGDRDRIVPFGGGLLFDRPGMPRVRDLATSLRPWLERNRCSGQLERRRSIDLVADIANTETDVLRPSQCAAAPVELWAVRGGGHTLALGQPALDKVWEFLEQSGSGPDEK